MIVFPSLVILRVGQCCYIFSHPVLWLFCSTNIIHSLWPVRIICLALDILSVFCEYFKFVEQDAQSDQTVLFHPLQRSHWPSSLHSRTSPSQKGKPLSLSVKSLTPNNLSPGRAMAKKYSNQTSALCSLLRVQFIGWQSRMPRLRIWLNLQQHLARKQPQPN